MNDRPSSTPTITDRKRSWMWRRVWAASCAVLFVGCGILSWPSALIVLALPVWVMDFREMIAR